MTTAAQGVQKALARAGSSVIAIAEMTADDLMAQMTDDQKTTIAASLAPAASAEMPPKKKEGCSEDGDEDDKEGDADPEMKGQEASNAAPALAADPRIKAVAKAVETDDACKGKADLALSMLADDDYAGLSASGIVKLLGKAPASSQAASSDPEASERAAMKAALSANQNSNVDPNGGGNKGGKPSAGANVWDLAAASNNPGRPLA